MSNATSYVVLLSKSGKPGLKNTTARFVHGTEQEVTDALAKIERESSEKVVGMIPKALLQSLHAKLEAFEQSFDSRPKLPPGKSLTTPKLKPPGL